MQNVEAFVTQSRREVHQRTFHRCPLSLQVHTAKHEMSGKLPNSLVQDSIIEPAYIYFVLVQVFEEYHAHTITDCFNSRGHALPCPASGLFPIYSNIAIK